MTKTYCTFSFRKKTVDVSYAVVRNGIKQENLDPNAGAKSYKWSLKNNILTIIGFEKYDLFRVSSHSIIGEKTAGNKVVETKAFPEVVSPKE